MNKNNSNQVTKKKSLNVNTKEVNPSRSYNLNEDDSILPKPDDFSQESYELPAQNMKLQKSLQHWSELRFSHVCPERRGYHTSFMYQGKLYIYGGYDINEGLLNNLWCLNIDNLKNI